MKTKIAIFGVFGALVLFIFWLTSSLILALVPIWVWFMVKPSTTPTPPTLEPILTEEEAQPEELSKQAVFPSISGRYGFTEEDTEGWQTVLILNQTDKNN